MCRYSGGSDILAMIPNGPNGDILTTKIGIPGFTGFQDPIDITEDEVTGNLYVSDFGRQSIVLVKPSENSSPEPAIQLNPISVITDDVADGVPGEEITVFLTNTGNAALLRPSVSVEGADAGQFVVNTSTLPTLLDPNRTASFILRFNPTTPGSKRATLMVSGENTSVTGEIDIRGLGKRGVGGNNEPSLQQIFDTYGLEITVGDTDPSTNIIDLPGGKTYNDLLGDEQNIQFFQRAVNEPVQVELLSVFGPEANSPIVGLGWYESGIAATSSELFTVRNNVAGNGQTLNPQLTGVTGFDPGEKIFGFYSRWPFFDNRYLYSEDGLNTFEGSIPHHVRVYEVPNVDNTFIVAFEEHVSGFDYQDIVLLVRNVEPAVLILEPKLTPSPAELVFEAGALSSDPDVREDTRTVSITNTGNAPLQITGVSIAAGTYSGEYSFTGPQTVTIAPASAQEYTVTFRPQGNDSDRGMHESGLVFETNLSEPVYTLGLYGLKKRGLSGNLEPPLQDVVNTLGYGIDVGWTTLSNNTDPALEGQEVAEPLFEAAGPGAVGIAMVARYSPAAVAPYGYYNYNGNSINFTPLGELADGELAAQQLNPPLVSGAPATGSFQAPRGPFGLYVYVESLGDNVYTEDALNIGTVSHRSRVYPVRNRGGALVANSYLVTFEEASNGDYQDYVMLLTNAKPYVAPPPTLTFEPQTIAANTLVGQGSPVYTASLTANTNLTNETVTLSADVPWIVLPTDFSFGDLVDLTVDASLLGSGVYTGTVSATAAGFATATLAVTATVEDAPPAGTVKINFQDDSFTAPFGYLPDVGLAYGARSNGQRYGWIDPVSRAPKDNTAAARGDERGITNQSSDRDKLLRSFNQFDLFGQSDPHDWEIDVPNGLYRIELAAGDPSNTNSRHTVRVEGEVVIDDFIPSPGSSFRVGVDTVRVNDGKLTVDDLGAPDNANSKIIYLDVIPVDSSSFAPDIAIDLRGNSNPAGEYYGQVEVTLSARDRSGSGSAGDLFYSLNGGPSVRYTGPFVVSIPEGLDVIGNLISASATDGLGNTGTRSRNFTLIPASGALIRLQNMTAVRYTPRAVPSDSLFSFNKIERPFNFQGTFTATRLENTLRIHNDGTSPLVIRELGTTDDSLFAVRDVIIADTGLVIAPGSFADVTLAFVANNIPYLKVVEERLVIRSNADNGVAVGARLRGIYQRVPEGSDEPNVTQLMEVMGLQTVLARDRNGKALNFASSDIPTYEQVQLGREGDMVLASRFVMADQSEQMLGYYLAAFHSRGANRMDALDPDGNVFAVRFRHGSSWFQSILPWGRDDLPFLAGDRRNALGDTPFTIVVNGYSSAGGNNRGQFADRISGIRIYKAIDENGRVVPNEYVVMHDNVGNGCDVPRQGNCDWQDNIIYITNMRPVEEPSASAIADLTLSALEQRDYNVASSFDIGYAGNRLTYSATVGDGQPLPAWIELDSLTGTFSLAPGTAQANQQVEVTVTGQDYNLLTVSSTFTITVTPTSVNCTVESNVGGGVKALSCDTRTVVLSGNVSIGGYRWTGPNGFTSSAQNPEVSVAGRYTLRSSDPSCPTASSVVVTPGATPSNLTVSTEFTEINCTISSTQLTARSDDPSSAVTWFRGNSQVGTGRTLSVTSAGVYRAEALSDGGCTASASVTITEDLGSPSAGNDGTVNVCGIPGTESLYEKLRQLGGDPQKGGSWTFNGQPVNDAFNPAVSASGDYVYTAGGQGGCGTDQATLTLAISTPTTYYADVDRDGFGDPAMPLRSCVAPPGYVTNRSDNCPTVNSSTLANSDGDALGDACDPDDDNDGVPDVDDCEPFNSRVGVAKFYYADFDQDGFGDPENGFATCALPPANYVSDNTDNCPDTANPNQVDSDNDGVGDICDNSATGASIFWLEAECGEIGSNWDLVRDAEASEGAYLQVPDLNSRIEAPKDVDSNYVRFIVAGVQAGEYRLFGRVYAINPQKDSYWVRINGGEWFQWSDGFTYEQWVWSEVTADPFDLEDGISVIDVAYREFQTRLDKLYLSQDGELPTGLGDPAINCISALNQVPIADITFTPPYGSAPLSVTLDGSGSRDLDGTIEQYEWDWGSGTIGTATPRVNFSEGTYEVTLTVTDNGGASSSNSKTLRVLNPDEDTDADGVINSEDICPLVFNPSQFLFTYYSDADNDGLGDPNVFIENCEPIPGFVENADDNCPDFSSTNVVDSDNDGIGDQCDDDDDGDGVPDVEDCKPLNPRIGAFATYYADFDNDGFGDPNNSVVDCSQPANYVLDNTDNCPNVANADQLDADNDGIGNPCDASIVGKRAFWLEAECGIVGSNWTTVSSGRASGDSYIVYPRGQASNNPPDDVPENRVRFEIEGAQSGTYHLYARILAASGSDDSFWFRINGGEWIKWASGITTGTTFQWNEFIDSPFELPDGSSTIDIAHREDGAQLDKIHLNVTGIEPTGVGSPATNCVTVPNVGPVAVANASPASGLGPLEVTLDGSASSDEDGVIVRYTWNWQNGGSAVGLRPRVTLADGEYDITLTVEDEDGATDTDRVAVSVLVNTTDTDNDGVRDVDDNCPDVPNPDQSQNTYYADFDADGYGDPQNTILGCTPPEGYVENQADNCPDVPSASLTDTDSDGFGNVCDPDDDNDGVEDALDCFPLDNTRSVGPTYYADPDGDGFGDPNDSLTACFPPVGYVLNNTDNCPSIPNANQSDADSDGVGDVCDASVVGINVFWLEAECAQVGATWSIRDNATASGGKYVVSPREESKTSAPDDIPANRIRFTLDDVRTGRYYFYGRARGASPNDDSFWIRINQGRWVRWAGDIPTDNVFAWTEVTTSPFILEQGFNIIDIAFRENGSELDKLHINFEPVTPTDFGEASINCGADATNLRPVASAVANPASGPAPLVVQLDGSGSTDKDGSIASYGWNWSGGSATGVQPTATFPNEGEVFVTLTVTDDQGKIAKDRVKITIAPPDNLPPTAVASASPPSGTAPLTVDLIGNRSTDSDGTIATYEWAWGSGTATGPIVSEIFAEGSYSVTLTVTDDDGATDTEVITVQAFAEGGTDQDSDGVPDNVDNCPAIANADQLDTDSDGSG